MTTALGSVLAIISNTANSATLRSTQLYAPYGSRLYQDQSMSAYTTKGFTGQYNDPTSGLDYYISRYYDPVAGVFLSADIKAGNMQGMNPYGYVGGNPETTNDPTGQMVVPPPGGGGGGSSSSSSSNSSSNNNSGGCTGWWCGWSTFFHQTYNVMRNVQHAKTVIEFQALDFLTGYSAIGNDIQTMNNDQASLRDRYSAGVDLLTNLAMDALLLTGVGEEARAGDLVQRGADEVGQQLLRTAEDGLSHLGCSFTSATLVATVRGPQAIGTLHIGDKVLAYNPKTHKMEMQPILHVWIHPDNDLIDLTIVTTAKGAHGASSKSKSEVVHTNQKHPFLTTEHGFLPVGQITVGMHVVRADGRIGLITRWTIVRGTKMMYNLEVAQDHTFTVGDGQWIVHNCANPAEVFKKLTDSGYQLESHFIERWVGDADHVARGINLNAQNVVDILQDGSHYLKTGDNYYSATKGGITILYTKERNTLFDIIRRDVPNSGITPLRNLIPNWSNPFYWMDLKP
jgi:RHS repeat-associated protein